VFLFHLLELVNPSRGIYKYLFVSDEIIRDYEVSLVLGMVVLLLLEVEVKIAVLQKYPGLHGVEQVVLVFDKFDGIALSEYLVLLFSCLY